MFHLHKLNVFNPGTSMSLYEMPQSELLHIASWCIVLWWQELKYALIYIMLNFKQITAENMLLWNRKHVRFHNSWWILEQLIYLALITFCFRRNCLSKKRMGNNIWIGWYIIYATWVFNLSKRFWLLSSDEALLDKLDIVLYCIHPDHLTPYC